MEQALSIRAIVKILREEARASRQRRLLVLSGSQRWCFEQAESAINEIDLQSMLWVGGEPGLPVKTIQPCQAKQWLGQETDLIVINAWAGFDVDAFGALSGTVKAGGLLLLLTPPLHQWHRFNDPEHQRIAVYPEGEAAVSGRYLARLARLINGGQGLSYLSEDGGLYVDQPEIRTPANYSDAQGCITKGQASAVEAIKKVAQGHRKRPLVLTADRGRGKSSALGIAAGQLIQEGIKKIIVTAPSLVAAEQVFCHAAGVLQIPDGQKNEVLWQGGQIIFRAPDELIRSRDACDLLLIDEAAAIPASLLQKLLMSYSRTVFSSTIHGYEGTGRGFAVRFRKILNQLTPQWRAMHIEEPVRWALGDPLETFTFDALMLKAMPATRDELSIMQEQGYRFEKLDRDQLVGNDRLLSELFGLLVLAHYKTRPFDLRHLLDGSNIEIYALRAGEHILATVLVAMEGMIESALEKPIWLGQRRIRGHLIPQSLSNHVGISSAVFLKGARVIRIAVHPDFQRQQLGLRLLEGVCRELSQRKIDYIGSVFGATPELLAFWKRAGLMPVRLGLNREASSGVHSVMMLKPLSEAGLTMTSQARERFSEQFSYLLSDVLGNLEADIVLPLLKGLQKDSGHLTDMDRQDIQSFVQGARLYECCIAAIKKIVWQVLSGRQSGLALERFEEELLVVKVLQNKSWTGTARLLELKGKKQALSSLRKALGHWQQWEVKGE
ncbi:GNAT family N-acetyltransferase [Endozoicomonas sp. Mp262]|uniref:tRNA(Met) cytidine acetyltransferase TmcA n=1 Tax=Endozoicomonas sp. Mp262 TaxID=2919499 RepID=UPI0021DB5640